MWLTHNQQVSVGTVHPRFICADTGNVSSVREDYSRDGQYALDVQAVLSAGADPLIYFYTLRMTFKGKVRAKVLASHHNEDKQHDVAC